MKAALITFAVAVIAASAGYVGVTLYAQGHASQTASSTPAAGNTIDNANYHCWNNYCEYFAAVPLKTSTSTVCAIQAPSASSTISGTVRVDVGSTTATTWYVGVGPTPYATTTAYGTAYTVAGGAQAYIMASSSSALGVPNVVPPNYYLIFYANGGITSGDTAATGFTPTGTCRVKFETTAI